MTLLRCIFAFFQENMQNFVGSKSTSQAISKIDGLNVTELEIASVKHSYICCCPVDIFRLNHQTEHCIFPHNASTSELNHFNVKICSYQPYRLLRSKDLLQIT